MPVTEHRIAVDPQLVKVAQGIYDDMTGPNAPRIGNAWSIVIERFGLREAEIKRTIDEGVTLAFYAVDAS